MGADFDNCLTSIRERLYANPVALQIPDGAEADYSGSFDLIEEKYYYYPDGDGSDFEVRDIPDDWKEKVELARSEMIESLANEDEDLMEKFLEDETSITVDDIKSAVKNLTLAGKINAVLCGSSCTIAVQMLIDGDDFLFT